MADTKTALDAARRTLAGLIAGTTLPTHVTGASAKVTDAALVAIVRARQRVLLLAVLAAPANLAGALAEEAEAVTVAVVGASRTNCAHTRGLAARAHPTTLARTLVVDAEPTQIAATGTERAVLNRDHLGRDVGAILTRLHDHRQRGVGQSGRRPGARGSHGACCSTHNPKQQIVGTSEPDRMARKDATV